MNQADIERLLQSYPDMLTVHEVAAVLRVHPRSIQRWARDGQVAAVRVGRGYRIARNDIVRWMLSSRLSVDDRSAPAQADSMSQIDPS